MKKKIAAIMLGIFILGSSLICPAEEKGLVGYWNFDEGSGEVAKDSSGNGKDGQIKGTPHRVKQDKGYALNFDGIDNEVVISNAPVFSPSDNWTVSFWSKIDPSQANWQGVIQFKQDGAGWGIYASHGDSGAPFLYTEESRTGAKNPYFHGKPLKHHNDWKHYALIKNGSTYTWYINGELNAQQNKGEGDVTMNTSSTWRIGSKYVNRYKGILDEVRVYSRALTAQETKNHYEGEKENKPGSEEEDGYL